MATFRTHAQIFAEDYPEYCPTHGWPQDRCRDCRRIVDRVGCPECGADAGRKCFESDRMWGHVDLDRPHEPRFGAVA